MLNILEYMFEKLKASALNVSELEQSKLYAQLAERIIIQSAVDEELS